MGRVFREDLKNEKNGIVVWQHAYGDTSENVWAKGKIDILGGYCVIVPEALAHGTDSSKPTNPVCYSPVAQARNIMTILDKEGITNSSHYIGYQMGGYIGSCVLAFYPERWASVAIGG